MSTFERVQKRILREMESCQSIDSMTWANIMLRHTAQLTSETEQKKFWNWMTNPSDADLAETTIFTPMPEPTEVQPTVTAIEDNEEIELENRWKQNGLCTFIRTAPKRGTRTSGLLLSGRKCEDEEDEKVAN